MEPLVEVVTNQELELALSVKAQVIGVNNRSSVQKGHGLATKWLEWQPGRKSDISTSPKSNIDTQNDGLEKVTPFKYGYFLVSMLVFRGLYPSYPKNPGVNSKGVTPGILHQKWKCTDFRITTVDGWNPKQPPGMYETL